MIYSPVNLFYIKNYDKRLNIAMGFNIVQYAVNVGD